VVCVLSRLHGFMEMGRDASFGAAVPERTTNKKD
jgi:hypothetical protein